MEKEIKDLMNYIKKSKKEIEDLDNIRQESKEKLELEEKELDKIEDFDSGFYNDQKLKAEEAKIIFIENLNKWSDYRKNTEKEIENKKASIIEKLEQEKRNVDENRNLDITKAWSEIKDKNKELADKKNILKYYESTLLTLNGEGTEENKKVVEDKKNEITIIETELKEKVRIINLVQSKNSPLDVYNELSKQIEEIKNINLDNFESSKLYKEENKKNRDEEDKLAKKKAKEEKIKKEEDLAWEEHGENCPEPNKEKVNKEIDLEIAKHNKEENEDPIVTKEEKDAIKEWLQGGVNNPQKPVKTKTGPKKDTIKILLDASTNLAMLQRGRAGVFSVNDRTNLEELMNPKKGKEIRNDIAKKLRENGDKKYARDVRLFRRKLNPAVLGLLNGYDEELNTIKRYIDAVKEGNKDKLPFDEYNIKLEDVTMTEKPFIRLNKYALRDNKNLGTDFNATKFYTLKKFLSRLPGNAKFVERWIGTLPEPLGELTPEERKRELNKRQIDKQYTVAQEEVKKAKEALAKAATLEEKELAQKALRKAKDDVIRYNRGPEKGPVERDSKTDFKDKLRDKAKKRYKSEKIRDKKRGTRKAIRIARAQNGKGLFVRKNKQLEKPKGSTKTVPTNEPEVKTNSDYMDFIL